MAKESFVLFKSFYEPIKGLSSEDKGNLLDAIFQYQIDGIEPTNTSRIYMAFMFFKNQFRLDEAKWEKVVEKRREAGSLGGKQKVANVANATDAKQSRQGVANVAVNVTENVNENVTVKVNDNETVLPKQPSPSALFVLEFNKVRNSKFRNTDSLAKKVSARLKEGYTIEQMISALKNAMQVQFHKDNGYRFLTPEFFSRADKIDMNLNATPIHSSTQQKLSGDYGTLD